MQAIAQAPSLTRSQLSKRANTVYGLAAGAMFAVFAAVGGMTHSAPRWPSATALVALGLLTFALLVTSVAHRKLKRPVWIRHLVDR